MTLPNCTLTKQTNKQPMVDPLITDPENGAGGYLEGSLHQTKYYVDKNAHNSVQEEWDQLFKCKNMLEQLKFKALDGNMGTKRFRSICWRLFWECLPEEEKFWLAQAKVNRQNYADIRKKYVIDPYEQKQDIDLSKHHPLSLAEDSIWHKYFQDNELRSTIMQDIDRLCPEIEFFKQENVKSIILHVLFCYAREHPQVSYKQGMHELLANLVYVMMTNSLAVKDCTEKLSETITSILDISFIEHDAYSLFQNIMDVIEPWFTNLSQNQQASQQQSVPTDRRMFQKPNDNQMITAISKKLNRIQNYMLKRYDAALSDHLQKIDITPQLYGIRWIRLLFGREFSLNRLLILWDALFADGMSLDLVDFVYLAMLINLRGVLLQNDFNHCLTYLMKYPANTDTKYILKRAIFLKNSKPQSTSHPHTVHKSSPNHRSKPPRPVHPVRNRLGETKEQMYANALGSGSHPVQHSSKRSGSLAASVNKSQFYTDGPTNVEAKTDFSESKSTERNTKTSVASQISNLKTKVGSPTQIINRISNPIRTTLHRHRGGDLDVNALAEDHSRLQKQVSELKSELDMMQSLCAYCGGKMDLYLNLLQDRLLKEEKFSDEVGILSLTGLKQVRDIFKDGKDFRSTVQEYDVDFNDIDRHIATASGLSLSQQQVEKETSSTPVADLADFNYFETDSTTQEKNHNEISKKRKGECMKKNSLPVESEEIPSDYDPSTTVNNSNPEPLFVPLESSDVTDSDVKLIANDSLKGELSTVTGHSESTDNLCFSEHLADPLSAFVVDT
ncbi:TBC1 domain family member 5-like isoform X2 [Hydractinia symbiolongicarpus]|uniref:TBC1 domain family member 5-like isoform X2 n=1 Tax=Hydractinia symbiolongicarpus TaxID=13093 RepID=UPI00254DC067|nr:TBC1 domain family member 5-like isoform X2 [Hydractinia symbiolongicarpus]